MYRYASHPFSPLGLGLSILIVAALAAAQDRKINVIAFGAHPDDCDGRAG